MGLLDLFRSRKSNPQKNALQDDEDWTFEDEDMRQFMADEREFQRREVDRWIVRLLPTAVCATWVKRCRQRESGPPYPSLQELRANVTAYLVPTFEDEGTNEDQRTAVLSFMEENFAFLFCCELRGHEADAALWPPLTWEEFNRYFEIEITDIVLDMAGL
jgi:hypothetical protein